MNLQGCTLSIVEGADWQAFTFSIKTAVTRTVYSTCERMALWLRVMKSEFRGYGFRCRLD